MPSLDAGEALRDAGQRRDRVRGASRTPVSVPASTSTGTAPGFRPRWMPTSAAETSPRPPSSRLNQNRPGSSAKTGAAWIAASRSPTRPRTSARPPARPDSGRRRCCGPARAWSTATGPRRSALPPRHVDKSARSWIIAARREFHCVRTEVMAIPASVASCDAEIITAGQPDRTSAPSAAVHREGTRAGVVGLWFLPCSGLHSTKTADSHFAGRGRVPCDD